MRQSTTTSSPPWIRDSNKVITSPLANDKYTTLKKHLTETFGLSRHEKASCLLHFCPLGDTKSLVFMDKMLALLSTHKPFPLPAALPRTPTGGYMHPTRWHESRWSTGASKVSWCTLAKPWHGNRQRSLMQQTIPKEQETPTQIQSNTPGFTGFKWAWMLLPSHLRRSGSQVQSTMFIGGIRPGQWLLGAIAAGHNNGLLYLTNFLSKPQLLVGAGAKISIPSATGLDTCTKQLGLLLIAANGSHIRTFRSCILSLHFTSNVYSWKFIITDVTHPLLGADFLCATSLQVAIKGRRLADATTFHSIPLAVTTSATSVPHLDAISSSDNLYHKVLADFPDITTPNFT